MDNGKVVWGPHVEHGFVLGTIVDIGQTNITVKPENKKYKVRFFFVVYSMDT